MIKINKNYSDEELIKLYIEESNQDAFREIYNRNFKRVYNFVYSRVGNQIWTEDIVSETFITLLSIIKNYNNKSKLSTFIISIALNKIRSFWYEKNKKKETIFDENYVIIDEISEEEEIIQKQINQILDLVLSKIDERESNILKKRFIENLSIKEVSKELNISPENVRVIQHRALKKASKIAEEILNEKPN